MNADPGISRTLDYQPCRYGASKIMFRGPARRLRGEYVTFLGGCETFGRFVEAPFPDLVEQSTGLTSVNLGCPQTGIDTYLSSPGLMDICNMARATVIQVVGAANMSNRFYTVDPRRNERFLRASRRFKELYPELDFTRYEATSHMLTDLARVGPERLHHVRHELQCAWVARMRVLLRQIEGPKVLLWLADHAPFSAAQGGTICREPLFVDRAMLNAVSGSADAVVEIFATPDEIAAGRPEMVFDPFDHIAAQELLGPVVHRRLADTLTPVLSCLSQRPQAERDEPPLLLV